jgi:hypothetical protein
VRVGETSKDLTQRAQRPERRGHGETWVARNENAKRLSSGAKAHSQRVVYVGAEAPTPEVTETPE